MSPVFADTSYYLAILSPDDAWHQSALTAFRDLNQPVVTSEYVLLELGAHLSKPPYRSLFVDFIAELRNDDIEILPATRRAFDAGLARFAQRLDKKWSLTDCISFCLMEEYGITDVLSSDRDFAQAGFHLLLQNL